MEYRTFEEWSNSGFIIKKGSKGVKRDSKVVFSDKQVYPKPYWSDDQWREMGEFYGEDSSY